MPVCVCVCVCVYVYIYVCVCVCVRVYIYVCMCMCMSIYMCVCVYIYVCVCVLAGTCAQHTVTSPVWCATRIPTHHSTHTVAATRYQHITARHHSTQHAGLSHLHQFIELLVKVVHSRGLFGFARENVRRKQKQTEKKRRTVKHQGHDTRETDLKKEEGPRTEAVSERERKKAITYETDS